MTYYIQFDLGGNLAGAGIRSIDSRHRCFFFHHCIHLYACHFLFFFFHMNIQFNRNKCSTNETGDWLFKKAICKYRISILWYDIYVVLGVRLLVEKEYFQNFKRDCKCWKNFISELTCVYVRETYILYPPHHDMLYIAS